MKTSLGLAFVLAIGCGHPAAPPIAPHAPAGTPAPLAIGETFQLDSKILGERRVINVYLPPGYRDGAARFPVLYMPDGGIKEDFPHITGLLDVSIKNELIRPFIVVGIENTERRRDLVGPTDVPDEIKAAPHAGGADRFREFLRTELKPMIAAHYRITGESALIGESLAGLFVVETLLVAPDLFDTYIAADPSVWWNHQAVVRSAAARFAAWSAAPKTLFVATADAPEMAEGVNILLAAQHDHTPAGLVIRYQPLPDEHHNTIYPVAALKAFRTVFALPPAPPPPTTPSPG